MSIEDRYLSGLVAVQYPDAPVADVQLAAGPSDTVSDAGGGVRVGRAGVPYKSPSMRDITEPAGALLDMGAATVKGATQGFIGLPGDLENIGRMVLGAMGVQAGEKTVLPTTDEVKLWLDTNVGQVGNGQNPYESIGEVVAPGGQVKAVKAAGRGAKALAPKAGEMILDTVEKTGLPVRGLNLIEQSLTTKGAKLAPDLEVPAAGDITKPAFKKWFGDSKVTDDKGQPLVVYHGTGKDFESFQKQMGRQFFFSPDPAFAEEYAKSKGGNIIPAYIKAEKVWDFENPSDMKVFQNYLKLTDEDVAMPQGFDAGEQYIEAAKGSWSFIESREFQTFLKRNGYDGFYVEDAGVKNIGVFEPTQIKSVFNKGTWNPEDPRILHGAGAGTAGTAATMQDKENK